MSIELKYSASVESYLSGEMSPAEKDAFEKELATNQDLSKELNFSRTVDSAIEQEEIIDFRKKLLIARQEGIKHKAEPEVKVVRMNFRKFWYAAASVIVLAALGATLYLVAPGSDSNERLFKQYYNSENLIDVTRSGDANIVEAAIKFQEKDYQLAARLFKLILEKDNSNIAGWFYYGISSIETENYEEAEKAFNHIIADNQNLYVEHAEWYLGLSYLRSNKLKEAKQQFAKIADNPDNFHRQEAKHLLGKLSK